MGTSTFSTDGQQWIFADVFGALRVGFGKKLKLKLSTKFFSPAGSVSLNASGTLALVTGRATRGTRNEPATVLVNLPTLGVRDNLGAHLTATSLFTLPAGDRVASLEFGALVIYSIIGDRLSQERVIALATPAANVLPARGLAPLDGPPAVTERLLVAPDGRFVALTTTALHAGRIGADAGADVRDWTLPLARSESTAVGLSLTDDAAWLSALDARSDEATVLRVARDGTTAAVVRKSLAMPAITEALLVTQPDSATVETFALASGEVRAYDVSSFNPHPADRPEDGAFPHGRPADPTRLPGHVAARDGELWFVPWHAEFVVDLGRQQTHARELGASAGPYRRLLLEEHLRVNQQLRPLGVQCALGSFEPHPKHSTAPFSSRLPQLGGALRARLAACLTSEMISRVNVRTHGWSWGGFGMQGGAGYPSLPASLDETRTTLEWMRAEDLLPLEFAVLFASAYDEALGIPSHARPDEVPFNGAAERLWTRAMLETLGDGRWTVTEIPATWATDPIDPAWAAERVVGLATWSRWRPYEATRMLAKTLARHMGTEALPALRAMIASAPERGFNWKQIRDAGEAMVWLCHQHPSFAPEETAFVAAEREAHSTGQSASELEIVRGALARGARHLWSNG